MKKELITEIKRMKQIMGLNEGLGTTFSSILSSSAAAAIGRNLEDWLNSQTFYTRGSTFFNDLDDLLTRGDYINFLNRVSDDFTTQVSMGGGMTNKIAQDFDDLMKKLDPNWDANLARDGRGTDDFTTISNRYGDIDTGDLVAHRVQLWRNINLGSGGSGKSVKDDIEKILKSNTFKDAYGSNASKVEETLRLLTKDLENIISPDDLLNTWLPRAVKSIEQNVQLSRQLKNADRAEKQAASKSRAQAFYQFCQNLVTRWKGTKEVVGEAGNFNYLKFIKRIIGFALILFTLGVITILNKETLFGIATDEGWETIKGIGKEALDLIRKKKVKDVNDTVKIIQDTLISSGGDVSDVEEIPVVEPDPNNSDGVIVTGEPFEPAKQDTTPTETTPDLPKDEEDDMSYLDKRLSRQRTGLA